MSKIRESARGEDCHIRIPGVCNFTKETVIWAHGNGSAAGKGIGMKSNDLLGAYACSACHDAYDRRSAPIFSREQVELMFWQGHARSLLRLIDKGIVVLERGKVKVKTQPIGRGDDHERKTRTATPEGRQSAAHELA